MPIPNLQNEVPINQYTASNGQTEFSFTFYIFATSDIKVYVNDVLKTITTDYVVRKSDGGAIGSSDLPLDGGKIIFNVGLSSGAKVSLNRDIPVERSTQFTTGGGFFADNLNTELTRILAIQQQITRDIGRSFRLAPSDAEGGSLQLPTNRASNILAFDASGNLILTKLADIDKANVSPFISTLLDDVSASVARGTLDAQQLNANLTALAGLASITNLSALAGLTGASNKLPYFTGDGTMAVRDLLATTTNQGISYLNNPITIANNTTDANNDIDFSAGNAPLDDGSGQVLLTSTLVKRLDATWSAGTGNGGLFNGTAVPKANSTKYYLFAITNGTINDAGFDSSPNGANIPAGYKGSYRGMVKTDSSGNILAFKQTKNKFLLTSPITEFSGTVASTYTNLTSTNVPLKSEIEAIVNLYLDVPIGETNGRAIIFKDLISNQQKQVILSKPASTIVLFSIMPDVLIGLNSSGQFQYKSTDASTGLDSLTTGTFQIKLNGWIDNNIKL